MMSDLCSSFMDALIKNAQLSKSNRYAYSVDFGELDYGKLNAGTAGAKDYLRLSEFVDSDYAEFANKLKSVKAYLNKIGFESIKGKRFKYRAIFSTPVEAEEFISNLF